MIVLGIDPGLSGALALMRGPQDMMIADMPTLTLSKAGKAKRRIDCVALAGLFSTAGDTEAVDLVVIEQPMAMPGQSAPSVFDIGRSTGIVEGMAATLRCRVELVVPSAWKKRMGVPAAKDGAIARASQLMPWAAEKWPLKKHDGRAEAALLALYGVELLQGKHRAR